MTIKNMLKGAAAATVMMAFGVANAAAQAGGCEETQFTSSNYEFYGKAETELLVNKNPAAALAALNTLMTKSLNCYERGAALRLGAAIKIENGDYTGAVRDLEQALDQGYIPASDAMNTYYTISQIYLNEENLNKSLEYYDKWMRAGGVPNRDQKWTLAVLYQKLDRNNDALRYAEQVFATDGPNAKREVYDFLIYLYEQTGNLEKKAQLLEQLLIRNPTELRLWEQIRGDYFRANNERKAFEVHKAMYLAGLVTAEADIMRMVNFYNQFNAPYQAAKILEKEINAGRVAKNYSQLERLATLYQVAREYEKAIPVIEEAAAISSNGEMYERLGRSYSELKQWNNVEDALTKALDKGGLKNAGLTWVLIGQSRYERDDRSGAREAFRRANNRAGRGWLQFMDAEVATEVALRVFEAQSKVDDIIKEKERCDEIAVLGGEPTALCQSVETRLAEAEAELERVKGSG